MIQGLYLITPEGPEKQILHVVREALLGGARVIQYRDKQRSIEEQINLARQLVQLCKEAGATFLVNDHPEVALGSFADGVHIGQDDASVSTHIAAFTRRKDGRAGYLKLYEQYLGPDNVQQMASMAETTLQTTVYKGETRNFSFQTLVDIPNPGGNIRRINNNAHKPYCQYGDLFRNNRATGQMIKKRMHVNSTSLEIKSNHLKIIQNK